MTSIAAPDAETVMVQFLASVFADDDPETIVCTDLLDNFGGSSGGPTRAVWVASLDGDPQMVGWDGQSGLWQLPIDVYTFDDTRVGAIDMGRRIIDALPSITAFQSNYGQITRVRLPIFSRRPDWTTGIRRQGGTVVVWTRQAQQIV